MRLRPGIARSLAEAVAVAVLTAVAALVVNALRSDGLPLVATQPYQTMVPCPEPGGPVTAIAAEDPVLGSARCFIIDARPAVEYEQGHLGAAINVPFDWLDPVPEATMAELAQAIAASGATRVAVYGDGGRPDSGEHLGREISGRGIKNVCFIEGGAAALLGAEATP